MLLPGTTWAAFKERAERTRVMSGLLSTLAEPSAVSDPKSIVTEGESESGMPRASANPKRQCNRLQCRDKLTGDWHGLRTILKEEEIGIADYKKFAAGDGSDQFLNQTFVANRPLRSGKYCGRCPRKPELGGLVREFGDWRKQSASQSSRQRGSYRCRFWLYRSVVGIRCDSSVSVRSSGRPKHRNVLSLQDHSGHRVHSGRAMGERDARGTLGRRWRNRRRDSFEYNTVAPQEIRVCDDRYHSDK